MRYRYSLRTAFVVVFLAAVIFAVMRWLGTPVTANARFYCKNDVLHVQCDVTGMDVALGRIIVIDETTNAELWGFTCVGNRTHQVEVAIGDNTPNSFGEGYGEFDINQFRSLKVVFRGFYVPLWPPAVSGWTTTYRLAVSQDEVEVIERTNHY